MNTDATRSNTQPKPMAQRAPEHVGAAAPNQRESDHVADHASPRRTRQRRGNIHVDPFYLPMDEIPDDLSYEWKRFSVHGEEDPFYIAQLRQQGWEPVPPQRHPTWVPPGYDKPNIIKGGQILMDRPKEFTKEAREELRQASNQQIREAEQRLGRTPKDTLTREHPGVEPRLTKEIMRQVAIEE